MFKARIQGFVAGLLLAILLISTLVFATPAIREVFFGVNVVVNGELQQFDHDSHPFISDGRTFLPVRGIAEALGVAVNWDGDTKTVYIGENPEISTNIGEIVEFGGIQWRILDVQDGRALLLSEYILEHRRYNDIAWHDITWETSTIRQWLNNEFYNRFTPAKRVQIVETNVITNDNPWFDTPGGNNTIDKIFLLSIDEIAKYFGVNQERLNNVPDDTTFSWHNFRIYDEYNESRKAYREDTNASYLWWLRSPGGWWDDDDQDTTVTNSVIAINFDGRVEITGANSNAVIGGVRPAMWVYL